MRILFLCANLSDYLYKCICFLDEDPTIVLELIHLGSQDAAPYDFGLSNLIIKEKEHVTGLAEHCKAFKPDLCYVAGWLDPDYLKIARILKKQGTKVVGAMDTPWNGSLRQWLGALGSTVYLRTAFDYLWVAGRKQYYYGRKLGFSHNRILDGLYTADVTLFARANKRELTKELLFAGRLEHIKGILLLYDVFDNLSKDERNGWVLKIIGNGTLKAQIVPNEVISVFDFMQPDELAYVAAGSGAFILPSYYEPWGVVVHEFVAAGLPAIVSTEVNAREEYVIHNYNGFVFQSGEATELRKALIRLFSLDQLSLQQMGDRSRSLALKQNHEIWKAKLLSIWNGN